MISFAPIDRCTNPLRGNLALVILLAGMVPAALTASAAEPVFEQILPAQNTTALLEHGGKILSGLEGGGLLIADLDDPSRIDRLTSGQELSGNNVSDLAWTGQNVWVATRGGGLTRISDLGGNPDFRQYTSNLGDLDVTAVTGAVLGENERVFYGMWGGGVGQINRGLSGNIYTAEDDGLISNNITALQMYQGDLFVGTPVGVSRFADNLFSDQNNGLTDLVILELDLDPDGNLVAAGNGGVYRWDPTIETWNLIGDLGAPVIDLSSSEQGLFALGRQPQGAAVLQEYDGAAWSPVPLPNIKCSAIEAGADFWTAGPYDITTDGGRLTQNYLARRLAGVEYEVVITVACQASNSEGAAFGTDGTAWIGDWFGAHATGYDPSTGSFQEIFEKPHAGNDTMNVFPNLGNILSMAGAPDGTVYIGQYSNGGIVRFNAATTRKTDLINRDNSGLQGQAIINLVVHPDGPLIVMHDWVDPQNVEILVDPDNWDSPSAWYLPPMGEGLGLGPSVWDALVERRDVIWFAVEDGGLVRWDVNGPNAGPDDPLTWFDESDDVWYDPVVNFPTTTLDPGKTLGLALGRDGSIWAGGNGLVQFTYDIIGSATLSLDVVRSYTEKSPTVDEGLVNGNVKDIAVDNNGDVWVATRTGLNRVSPGGEDAVITAWIDLGNYLGNPNYQLVYSPNVIAPLPGITYARIAAAHDGKRLLLTADQGTTLITVGSGQGTEAEGDPLDGVYCYPNPWTPGGDTARLKLGGLPSETVSVSVYNIDGQHVFTHKSVADQTGFWDGKNASGNIVASGMYVMTIATANATTTRTLAVVR